MAARLSLLARKRTARKHGTPQPPKDPSEVTADPPCKGRGPDHAHPQRWREAALRKHLCILRAKATPYGDLHDFEGITHEEGRLLPPQLCSAEV